MRVIAFDIETMIDPILFDSFAPPIKVKTGNLKDPAKIREKEQEAIAEQREMAALNPHISRVLSVHFAEATTAAPTPVCQSVFTLPRNGTSTLADREAETLTTMWRKLAQADRIVTFNGQSFDVPYIMRRSLLCGVLPAINIETGKYKVTDGKSNHLDVRRVLAETFPGNTIPDFVPGDLNYFAMLLLGDTQPDELDPHEMYELWLAGQLDRIRQYGERDALRTLQMYQKLEGFYFN